MVFRSVVLALVLGWVGQVGFGQGTPASATGTGTVTGHVICDDTQRPARFAGVILFGVPGEVTGATTPDPNDPQAIKKALSAGLGHVTLQQTKTGADGSFTLSDVPPGEYYAFASVPGYVSGGAIVQAAYAGGADFKKQLPGVPVVHVVADHTVVAEVSAQRGAAVSGRVVWDDGTPAPQVILQALPPGTVTQLPSQFAMLAGMSAMSAGMGMIADDQGRYRIAGLLPGEYVVKASLTTGTQFGMVGGAMQMGGMLAVTPLVVYAPDTAHKSSAQPVTLAKGEERPGEDVTIRLGGMHTVSGRVRSVEDGHGVNSATVKLTDVKDKDFVRSAIVDANGAYTVTLVPAGTYTVEVGEAEDTRPSAKTPTGLLKMQIPDTVRSYKGATGSAVVADSDVTGQNFDLQPEKDARKKPDLSDLLKTE